MKVLRCVKCGKIKFLRSNGFMDLDNMIDDFHFNSKREWAKVIKPDLCSKCLTEYNKLIEKYNKDLKGWININNHKEVK